MASKLYSRISVIPSELQHDIDATKSMKQRTVYVKQGWRDGMIHRAKIALRRMRDVASAFPEGSAVHTRYTVDEVLLRRDMEALYGKYWDA